MSHSQNQRPGQSTDLDVVRDMQAKIERYTGELLAVLPKGVSIQQLKQDALNCLRSSRDLPLCNAETVVGALMTCASLGLRPGVAGLGHAWLIPFKNWKNDNRLEAQLIIGYKGYVDLAFRHPAVEACVAHAKYSNDRLRLVLGAGPGGGDLLEHEPPNDGSLRGELQLFYATAVVRGVRTVTEPMTDAEMREHRDKYAMAKKWNPKTKSKDIIVGPWIDHYVEMGKKTMIRSRLVKGMPNALELTQALAVDDGVREDLSPDADPAAVTVNPFHADEEDEQAGALDPNAGLRESITVRSAPQAGQPGAPGMITADQDREISTLMRDRKLSKEQALDEVKKIAGERKSARQLTFEQAAALIEALKKIDIPETSGVVVDYDDDGQPHPRTSPDPARDPAAPAEGEPYDRGRREKRMFALLREKGVVRTGYTDTQVRAARTGYYAHATGQIVKSTKDLRDEDVEKVIAALEATPAPEQPAEPEQPATPDAGHDGGEPTAGDELEAKVRAEWPGSNVALLRTFFTTYECNLADASEQQLEAFLLRIRSGEFTPS